MVQEDAEEALTERVPVVLAAPARRWWAAPASSSDAWVLAATSSKPGKPTCTSSASTVPMTVRPCLPHRRIASHSPRLSPWRSCACGACTVDCVGLPRPGDRWITLDSLATNGVFLLCWCCTQTAGIFDPWSQWASLQRALAAEPLNCAVAVL